MLTVYTSAHLNTYKYLFATKFTNNNFLGTKRSNTIQKQRH